MTITIIPKNNIGVLERPNTFWQVFFVETPLAKLIDCEYTDRGTIRYEHDGYVGDWFTEAEALEMHKILNEFVKTDDYKNHRYFAERQSQMESMLEFLPICGGFKKGW